MARQIMVVRTICSFSRSLVRRSGPTPKRRRIRSISKAGKPGKPRKMSKAVPPVFELFARVMFALVHHSKHIATRRVLSEHDAATLRLLELALVHPQHLAGFRSVQSCQLLHVMRTLSHEVVASDRFLRLNCIPTVICISKTTLLRIEDVGGSCKSTCCWS